jgi:hypothetical protein
MDLVNINGKMEENIKDNINLIKNMELANILGRMDEDIMGNGRIVKDMDKVRLFMLMGLKN